VKSVKTGPKHEEGGTGGRTYRAEIETEEENGLQIKKLIG